jgi:hypothetical protein
MMRLTWFLVSFLLIACSMVPAIAHESQPGTLEPLRGQPWTWDKRNDIGSKSFPLSGADPNEFHNN